MAQPDFSSLPLEWIRVFEAAGRLGNFTAAANETGLTQAAVSQRISNLEARIGSKLFTRQARGVTLTVEGEAWLPYVSDALQSLGRSAEDLFGRPMQKITLSAAVSVTQLWLAPRLGQLSSKSNYQISLKTVNIEPDFSKAKSIIEIRYGRGDWPAIHKSLLIREKLAPVVAPELLKSDIPWHELPSIGVYGPRPGWKEWSMQTGNHAPPIPGLRFDSFVSARAAAISGAGTLLGSIPLCQDVIEQGQLEQASEDSISHEFGYWMISNDRKLPNHQWQELVDCLTG